jgi:hypothetical protein
MVMAADDHVCVRIGDMNLCAYVDNDPLNQADPLGLRSESNDSQNWERFITELLAKLTN